MSLLDIRGPRRLQGALHREIPRRSAIAKPDLMGPPNPRRC